MINRRLQLKVAPLKRVRSIIGACGCFINNCDSYRAKKQLEKLTSD